MPDKPANKPENKDKRPEKNPEKKADRKPDEKEPKTPVSGGHGDAGNDDVGKFTLEFLIDTEVIKKGSPDNICIAKKIEGKFTVISADGSVSPQEEKIRQLSWKNTFEWTDEYRVYAVKQYKMGMLVESESPKQKIKFGQQTRWDGAEFGNPEAAPNEDFDDAKEAQSPENSFVVKEIPSSFQLAIQSKVDNRWVTIYVDPVVHASPTTKVLTPTNEYLIFWANNMMTDYMIDTSRSTFPKSFKFGGNEKSKRIRFGYATENEKSPGEEPAFHEE